LIVEKWPILHYRVMSPTGAKAADRAVSYGLRAEEVRRDGAAGFIGRG
jgi:hypothetical protein